MFGKLKEKLKSWIKKTSAEEKAEEEIVEAPKEEKSKEEAVETSTKDEVEKTVLPVPEKYPEPPFKEIVPEKEPKEKPLEEKEFEELTEEEIDKRLEEELKKADEIKEEKLEHIKEITKEIEKTTKSLEKIEKEKKLSEKIQEIEEKEIKEEKEKVGKEGFFKRITSGIVKTKITEKQFEVYSEELEMLLLENNVAYEVAERIIKQLREKVVGKEFLKKEIEGAIETTLKDIMIDILVEPFSIIDKIKEKSKKPFVILFCGINGTGKTTSIAKIASQLQEKKLSVVIAAADTFRAASIEQLKKHTDKLGLKLIAHDYGADPAAVGFDAIKFAEKNRIDVVLIDTAGRMHSEKNLLKELEKISRVNKPDLKIFVGEAITGNDSIEQVRSFNFAIGIDGIILTKADTDDKGGTALSVGYVTKKPILYLGVGQEYKDLIPFSKSKFIEELGL